MIDNSISTFSHLCSSVSDIAGEYAAYVPMILKIEPSQKRTAALGLRVKPRLKAALQKAAAADRRTVASYVENLLADHLAKIGIFKTDEDIES